MSTLVGVFAFPSAHLSNDHSPRAIGCDSPSAPLLRLSVADAIAVESAMASATLSRRSGAEGESQPIARGEWSFDKCADGKAKTPTNVDICYPAGFSTNYVYDLIYEARDPMVMGLGFAATRDIVSFLRYDASDGNPLVAK